ncbi:hypothetical protein Afil01_57750 [Actinorhabdospora filicis]|uniref:SurA-like protein n=1 Tax=Actinorhabdospora filicis TaxID=1785913 RepID=A0A9W6SRW7_9ACTN|nr:hypothetical protein [Actinorhabdospora filicis]GLZ80968.1 hypothetical protein Afil01_57750 [Actinorhabdospora filicis]
MRRIATVAALALLAVGGLSACRVETGAAVFVADSRVGEDRVDAIVDSAPDALTINGRPAEVKDLRQQVVEWLTIVDLAQRVSADTGRPLPGPDFAAAAAKIGADSDNAFARLLAQGPAYKAFLFEGVEEMQASPEMVEGLVADYKAANGDAQLPADFGAQVLAAINEPTSGAPLRVALAQRNRADELFEQYDVLTNPRYGQLAIKFASIPVADGTAVMIEAPIPTSTTP